jgi:hypothetical protein
MPDGFSDSSMMTWALRNTSPDTAAAFTGSADVRMPRRPTTTDSQSHGRARDRSSLQREWGMSRAGITASYAACSVSRAVPR